jgi:hypothetical protein
LFSKRSALSGQTRLMFFFLGYRETGRWANKTEVGRGMFHLQVGKTSDRQLSRDYLPELRPPRTRGQSLLLDRQLKQMNFHHYSRLTKRHGSYVNARSQKTCFYCVIFRLPVTIKVHTLVIGHFVNFPLGQPTQNFLPWVEPNQVLCRMWVHVVQWIDLSWLTLSRRVRPF